MDELKVRVKFRSGHVKEIVSSDFYKGQFREWCIHNFIKNDYQRYDSVIWNNIYINLSEIEYIEEEVE